MKTLATILAFCLYSFLAVVLLAACALVTPVGWCIERKWFELVQLGAWLLTFLMLAGSVREILHMLHRL